ncbi:MAG: histidine phosphatase family protein [Deltaproteobacteria bacterium]|nr:MAG: histidine phosphatase family protein [Deltaproteobacteria bacterium]
MRQLYLVRHAKAAADRGVDDHDRPLAASGRAAATRVGAQLAQLGVRPSLILCSSSRRTVETLERLRAELAVEPAVSIERELYLASAAALLARVARVDAREPAVLLLGHNPGIADVARALVGTGERSAIARLAAQFPPGACAALRFEVASWRGLSPGVGTLTGFAAPQDLS